VIYRSVEINGFEFSRVSALRAAQLIRGCTPRVPKGHRPAITALREVAAGVVRAAPRVVPDIP
jgi:DNA-directed RNA polymerase subunit K/omega